VAFADFMATSSRAPAAAPKAAPAAPPSLSSRPLATLLAQAPPESAFIVPAQRSLGPRAPGGGSSALHVGLDDGLLAAAGLSGVAVPTGGKGASEKTAGASRGAPHARERERERARAAALVAHVSGSG
jgi:hypothetical protein